MSNEGGSLGTLLARSDTVHSDPANNADGAAVLRLWIPARGLSGLVIVARPPSLAAVVAGQIVDVPSGTAGLIRSGFRPNTGSHTSGRIIPVNLGGLIIVGNTRQKEPTRVIGHPDLASGASVQRGDTLYVSVAEAIYRETRGENVEVHLTPTSEDNEALSDLRQRARHRWESDRLPDGWTRPLPQQSAVLHTPTAHKDKAIGGLPDDLRALAERFRTKDSEAEQE